MPAAVKYKAQRTFRPRILLNVDTTVQILPGSLHTPINDAGSIVEGSVPLRLESCQKVSLNPECISVGLAVEP